MKRDLELVLLVRKMCLILKLSKGPDGLVHGTFCLVP